MERRTRAERDAITVEIGYALLTTAFVAGAVLLGVIGPAYFFDLPRLWQNVPVIIGLVLAPVAFVLHVAHVLWRYKSTTPQPIQPGRTTRPDS